MSRLLPFLLLLGCPAEEGAAPDLDAPQPTVLTPSPESAEVPVDAAVVVSFSEAIDPASVGDDTLVLIGPDGWVPGALVVDGDQLTLRPDMPLLPEARYTVTLDGSVADAHGNRLGEPVRWSFDTEDGGPGVLAVLPAPWAEDVTVDTVITIAFSEEVDPDSVTAETVAISAIGMVDGVRQAAGQPLAGELRVDGNVVSFRPDRGRLQEFETDHRIRIAGVRDLKGHAMDGEVISRFTTVLLDPDYRYTLHTEALGRRFALGLADEVATLVEGDEDAAWTADPIRGTTPSWSLQNVAVDDRFLAGGADDAPAFLAGYGDTSDQRWVFVETADRTDVSPGESPDAYRIGNHFDGAERSLAATWDGTAHRAAMKPTRADASQRWFLVNDGYR